MKLSAKQIEALPIGSRVLVRTRNHEYLYGVLVSHSDWLVGCPVVKLDNGVIFGAGYDGDIIGKEERLICPTNPVVM